MNDMITEHELMGLLMELVEQGKVNISMDDEGELYYRIADGVSPEDINTHWNSEE